MSDDTEDEYTPPTATVRYAYSMHSFGPQAKTNAEFDRWLEARDRENRAIGWDEGFDEGHYVPGEERTCECKATPYRGDTT